MILKNKKITVVGLGKSGFAAAKFLLGKKANLRVTDGSEKKEVLENASYLRGAGVDVEIGAHTESFLSGTQIMITSPGVSKQSLPLTYARIKKIPVISEIELGSFFCRGLIVAVTGSNGKTTTCNLIHRILNDCGRHSVLCGNVGFSFLDAMPEIGPQTTVVLELSSFQLEDSPSFRPHIAAVLNVSPNHLDRHKTFENYILAKEMIFHNQKANDHLILNYDDPVTRVMAKKTKASAFFYSLRALQEGLFYENHQIQLKRGKIEKILFDSADFNLKGLHNIQNIMTAGAVGTILKLPVEKMQESLSQFKTLEHRIEFLGEVRGVRFVNDSKSTTIESTRAAINSIEGPVILVAGGRDKGAPFAQIEALVRNRVKKVVLYGEAREKIAAIWAGVPQVIIEKDFQKAVGVAYEEARPQDTVLLSPMCASFDQFNSFEHRGETFKKIFHELGRSWNP